MENHYDGSACLRNEIAMSVQKGRAVTSWDEAERTETEVFPEREVSVTIFDCAHNGI
jgi:hypothetical protein